MTSQFFETTPTSKWYWAAALGGAGLIQDQCEGRIAWLDGAGGRQCERPLLETDKPVSAVDAIGRTSHSVQYVTGALSVKRVGEHTDIGLTE